MDFKIKIKEEESLSDDVASQNETEFSCKVATMKRQSDAVLLDVAIKTEIKAEAPFIKHLLKEIKTEVVSCSNNQEIDIEEQTLISDFVSQKEKEFVSDDPVMNEKYNNDHERGKKIGIEGSRSLETETSTVCDHIKIGHFPPVKSSRMTEDGLKMCYICKKFFLNLTQLYHHVTTHYFEQLFQCKSCGAWILTKVNLEKHECSVHQRNKSTKSSGDAPPPNRAKISDEGLESDEYYIYVRDHRRGRYVCEECNRRCKNSSMLKQHRLTHTDVKPFTCRHCNFSCKTKGNLTQHMKSKVHYKKCMKLGIDPVPTVVDDSYIDRECLARQCSRPLVSGKKSVQSSLNLEKATSTTNSISSVIPLMDSNKLQNNNNNNSIVSVSTQQQWTTTTTNRTIINPSPVPVLNNRINWSPVLPPRSTPTPPPAPATSFVATPAPVTPIIANIELPRPEQWLGKVVTSTKAGNTNLGVSDSITALPSSPAPLPRRAPPLSQHLRAHSLGSAETFLMQRPASQMNGLEQQQQQQQQTMWQVPTMPTDRLSLHMIHLTQSRLPLPQGTINRRAVQTRSSRRAR